MPVIKSAKKKLKQDKKRTIDNKKVRDLLKKTVKELNKVKTEKVLTQAFSIIDKAAKKNIIHKNKASRLKSSLSKKIAPSATKTAAAKPSTKTKKTSKK